MRRVRAQAALLLLLSAAATADPLEVGSFRLDWAVPADCPGSAETLARIETLLGAPVTEVLKVPLTARGRVRESAPGAFELSLETFQNEQRFMREMQAPSCSELTDAAALVLALAIDPNLHERLPAATALPAASPEPTAAPAASAQPAPSATSQPSRAPGPTPNGPPPSEPSTKRALRWIVGASAVADLGSVAPFGFGPGLTLGGRSRNLELDLDATWLPPRRSFATRDPDKGGDISLLAFALRPCVGPTGAAFEPGACGVFEFGSIRGEGFGTETQTTQQTLWLAAGGTLFARYRVASPLWLTARAGLLAPLENVEFTLENVGLAYAVPSVLLRLALGVEGHFE